MTDAEIIKLIKETVRVCISQTLLASFNGTTDNVYLGTIQRFATDSVIEGLRLVRPYGFASRPPDGTTTLVHPINGDPSHLVTLGDFDEGNRPSVSDSESAQYGSSGAVIYTDGGDIIIGDYIPTTGTFLPTPRAAFKSDGTRTIKNLVGTITMKPTGEIDLDGGTGASHGVGLGDVIENRLTALENEWTTFITSYNLHTHATAAPGPPSPPLPPASPFIPVPTPAASLTVKVST